MKRRALALLLLSPCLNAIGADLPTEGLFDRRIRFVDYNPDNITRVHVVAGFVMELAFEAGEQVLDDAWAGIPSAYDVKSTGNSVIVRPKADAPPTNLVVRTTKRTYWFDLVQVPKLPVDQSKEVHNDARLVYKVQFRYPAEDFKQAMDEAARKRAAREKDVAPTKLNAADKLSYEGDMALRPAAASVRGSFTVLRFRDEQEVPAVYVETSDGTESQVNRSLDGPNTIVVHFVGRKLVLRRGQAVGAVFNERFM